MAYFANKLESIGLLKQRKLRKTMDSYAKHNILKCMAYFTNKLDSSVQIELLVVHTHLIT